MLGALARTGQIVRIVDDEQNPRSGVILAVLAAEEPVPEMAYRTGEDGTVRIGLPEGRVVLEATVPGGVSRRFEIQGAQLEGAVHELTLGRN
jgi:hypothetical protein